VSCPKPPGGFVLDHSGPVGVLAARAHSVVRIIVHRFPNSRVDVHLFAVDGSLPESRFSFALHTLATLQFEGVEEEELEGFGPQNVLDDLVLRDLDPAFGPRVGVELPSNNGLGGRFSCRNVIVLAVEPYEPGPHSVYGQSAGD